MRIFLHKRVFLVDDQGAFASLKENQRFSEPFHGFSSLLHIPRKKHPKGCFFLVDDQGLEAVGGNEERLINKGIQRFSCQIVCQKI